MSTSSPLNIRNCQFINNKAKEGGAIFTGYDLYIDNSTFKDNSAKEGGGAIESAYSNKLYINWNQDDNQPFNTFFINNKAGTDPPLIASITDGGAINMENYNDLYVKNTVFTSNSALEDGGAFCCRNDVEVIHCLFESNEAKGAKSAQCEGGAIYCAHDLKVSKSEFKNNYADDYAGAIYAGTINELSYSTFTDNKANDNHGGAIYINNEGKTKFYKCSFEKNSCGDEGGAIYADSSSSKINMEQCSFIENSAGGDGGAIYARRIDKIYYSTFTNNEAKKDGGAIYINNLCTPIFYGCLFEKNSCGDEGGGNIH